MYNLPNLNDVTVAMDPEAAFAHADELFSGLIGSHISASNSEIDPEYLAKIFEPSTKLQIAGLSMIAGRENSESISRSVALACFALDHVLWGFTAILSGQPRIAFTLVRAAVEAAIFEAASALIPDRFIKKWGTPACTGGSILKDLVGFYPVRLQSLFEVAWKHTVPFGHASFAPVAAAIGKAREGEMPRNTITFGGQYAGPLNAMVLDRLVASYSMASLVAAESILLAIIPSIEDDRLWRSRYSDVQQSLNEKSPSPV